MKMSKEAYLVKESCNAGTIQYKNTTATAVAVGEVVNISTGTNSGLIGVSLNAIPAVTSDTTASGTVAYRGVFDLTNGATKSFTAGSIVNWDVSNNYVTDSTASGIYNAGLCVRTSDSSSDSFVTVDLNIGPKAFYKYS
jgi:hypothetical protein